MMVKEKTVHVLIRAAIDCCLSRTMSVAPTTTGRLCLQPSYFTSSVYVNAVRDDIAVLLKSFEEQYSNSPHSCPFKLFKEIWCSQGWQWLHLKIFDPRGRDAFSHTTLRLFLGMKCVCLTLQCLHILTECIVDLEKPNNKSRCTVRPVHVLLHSADGCLSATAFCPAYSYTLW